VCSASRHYARSCAGHFVDHLRLSFDLAVAAIDLNTLQAGAFSSEVDTGSREENASKQKDRARS
jgi:hypothetical protein